MQRGDSERAKLRRHLWLVVILLGCLLIANMILLASGKAILVGSVTERMVAYQGDIIIPAGPNKTGPDYSRPFNLTICRYWTGVRISHLFHPKNASRCEKIVD
jgi:hypothetical protein